MSFGYSVGDAILLGQLAWRTVQNSRKACGEHNEFTREASSLHVVIRRLEQEIFKPESLINRPNDKYKEELQAIVGGCEKVLQVFNKVLEKYNSLSDKERSTKRLWQRVRFGNGELADMRDLRERMTYYTAALSLFVNMVSMGSIGRVEQQMETAGGDIQEIRIAVNGITAHLLSASNREGSVLTTYAGDEKAVWKEFRKELIEEGFSSSIIRKNKRLIKAYIKELGDRGLLDDEDPHDVEDLSELAATGTDDYAAPSGLSNILPKAPSMAASKLESGIPKDDQVSIKENNVVPPPNEASDTACSSNTVPMPKPSNAFAMNGQDTFFHKSRINPATFKIIVLPAYERTKIITDDKHDLAVLSGDCLTVGEIGNTYQLLKERFKARLQILVECLPQLWMFQARGDIDEVHIYVANSFGIGMDYKVAELFAESASEIISKFTGSPAFAIAGILREGLNAFLPHGSLSQRVPWTKLEELISLNWELDETESVPETCFLIGKWIRRFDTEFGAIAKRLASAWAEAAKLITNSNYNGMRSLALICAREEVSSESRPQSQEEIDNLHPVVQRSTPFSESSPCSRLLDDSGDQYTDSFRGSSGRSADVKIERMLEGLDRGASEATTGASHRTRTTALPASETLLQKVRDHYIDTIVPQCEKFISNPPSFPEFRKFRHKKLSERIFSKVLTQLDAADLQGNHDLKQRGKSLVDHAEDMLFRLDEADKSVYAAHRDDEIGGQEFESQNSMSRKDSKRSKPKARRTSNSGTNGPKRHASTRSQKQPVTNDMSDEPTFTYIRPQASRFKEEKYFKPKPKANKYFFFNQVPTQE